jgi:uncharacterized protein
MPLIDTISRDIADAMRAKDQVRLGALRMAKAALMNREVEKGRALDEAESHQVIAALLKQRRDSVEQFQKFGRDELARKEQAEMAVLEAYIPPPADQADIDLAVADAIAETGATSPRDVGKVMKAVMPKLAGRTVDGKAVNELVRRKLGA